MLTFMVFMFDNGRCRLHAGASFEDTCHLQHCDGHLLSMKGFNNKYVIYQPGFKITLTFSIVELLPPSELPLPLTSSSI